MRRRKRRARNRARRGALILTDGQVGCNSGGSRILAGKCQSQRAAPLQERGSFAGQGDLKGLKPWLA